MIGTWMGQPSARTGAPSNAVLPAITPAGPVAAGTLLTVSNGTWTNSTSFTYQWRNNGAAIPGATAVTFDTTGLASAVSITCLVTARNFVGVTNTVQASNTVVIS